MKYTITLKSKWNRPYFYSGDNKKCINTEYSSYQTDDIEQCRQIVHDLLDVPEAEMSLEEVKYQFEDPQYDILSEEKLVSIQSYYNGRLGLYHTLMRELNDLDNTQDKQEFKHDIPYKYNHFIVEDDEVENEEQLEAYIEVIVEK